MTFNAGLQRLGDVSHELDSLAERRLLGGLDPLEQTRWDELIYEEIVLLAECRSPR